VAIFFGCVLVIQSSEAVLFESYILVSVIVKCEFIVFLYVDVLRR
jgi:hypothetical protein